MEMNMTQNTGWLLRAAGIALLALAAVTTLAGCCIGGPVGGFEITLQVGGTEYRMAAGYTDTDTYDSGANGSSFSGTAGFPPEEITGFKLAGAAISVTDMATEGPFILLQLSGDAPGTYTLGGDVFISLTLDGEELIFTPDFSEFTVTITESATELGGVIAGTITGSLMDGTPVTGTFRVERIGDDAIQTPDPFKV
jgi:hypothetical protein